MSKEDQIAGVRLLTQTDLERLGKTLARFCPLDDASEFSDLLRKVDEADNARLRSEPRV
jgi:hypothetical protein